MQEIASGPCLLYNENMSLKLVVPGDFPRVFLPLDDTSPFNDYSGYERVATCASTNYGTSLAKGCDRSLIVNNANKLAVSAPVFKQNKEYMPFSVGVFIRPVVSGAEVEQQIFGNDGSMDGLVLNGTLVSFVTKFTNTGEARASFDLIDLQKAAVYGVHTHYKNSLFVNGELVDEVDITPEQRLDTYVASGNSLTCGASTGGNALMMNALSIYDFELDDSDVAAHYAYSEDTLGAEDVATDYRGALLEFAPEGQLLPFYSVEYGSDEEWSLGRRENMVLDDGVLLPAVSQGVSQPGTWTTVLPLGILPSTIYAANLLWEGTGATVHTSRDGLAWEVAVKGRALTTVPRGTNGTGEFIFIRVSFPGGIVDDLSSFDNMVFALYATGTIPGFSGREVILDKATPEGDYDVIDFHENWGVELENGTVTIKSAPGDTGVPARTIEVWGNKGAGAFTDNLAATANQSYSNGGTLKAYAQGEWQLRHYVFDANFTGDIVFSGTGQIGHVVLYPQALTDDVIKEIYDSYTGKPKVLLDVDEVFDIHEFEGMVDIYEYDWNIESSG